MMTEFVGELSLQCLFIYDVWNWVCWFADH